MSEISISREEAIEFAKEQLNIFGRCRMTDFLSKAISDMEKLEKIEKLYEPKPFGEGLSREDRDKEIEQIVKG